MVKVASCHRKFEFKRPVPNGTGKSNKNEWNLIARTLINAADKKDKTTLNDS